MVITDFSRAYLVLHKLSEPDLALFNKNVKPMYCFWLTPNAVLIVPNSISELMQQASVGLAEPGKVTFIEAGQQIYTTMRTGEVRDLQTVFDK